VRTICERTISPDQHPSASRQPEWSDHRAPATRGILPDAHVIAPSIRRAAPTRGARRRARGAMQRRARCP